MIPYKILIKFCCYWHSNLIYVEYYDPVITEYKQED